MGLFDFRKKKQGEVADVNQNQVEQVNAPEEKEQDRWSQAHQANPQAYQDSNGSPFLVFTVTEETDTILPMDPRQMYKIKGKEVRDIRLGLVSTSEDQVIGDLPFYLCAETLAANTVESRPPFALVRGMSLEEMKTLIEEVQAEIDSRMEMQALFAENLDFLSRDEITPEVVTRAFEGDGLETYTFENVAFPTGELIAADPISYLQDPDSTGYLRQTVAPGRYPVTISIHHSENDSVRIVGMRVKFTPQEAVSYTLAEDYRLVGDEGEEHEEKGYSGFAVEAGMATFCDRQAAESYWDFLDEWEEENPDGNIYDDYLADLFAQSYEEHPDIQREGGDFIRFAVPGSEDEIVMAASGFGDGFYGMFWGQDTEGEIVELVTVFIDPDLYEKL